MQKKLLLYSPLIILLSAKKYQLTTTLPAAIQFKTHKPVTPPMQCNARNYRTRFAIDYWLGTTTDLVHKFGKLYRNPERVFGSILADWPRPWLSGSLNLVLNDDNIQSGASWIWTSCCNSKTNKLIHIDWWVSFCNICLLLRPWLSRIKKKLTILLILVLPYVSLHFW